MTFDISLQQVGYMAYYDGIPSRELTYPPKNGILKKIFLFPRWDMLIPWRVTTHDFDSLFLQTSLETGTPAASQWPTE